MVSFLCLRENSILYLLLGDFCRTWHVFIVCHVIRRNYRHEGRMKMYHQDGAIPVQWRMCAGRVHSHRGADLYYLGASCVRVRDVERVSSCWEMNTPVSCGMSPSYIVMIMYLWNYLTVLLTVHARLSLLCLWDGWFVCNFCVLFCNIILLVS